MTLKNITLLLVTFFFMHTVFAQSNGDMIKSIRKEFKAINDDGSLKKVVLENEEFMEQMTDRGGSLTGYYKEDKIAKIVEWIGISNGIYITEYYFKDEQLMFVYKAFKAVVYDAKKNDVDLDQTGVKFEGRYYFSNKLLIDNALTGTNPFKGDPANFPTEADKDLQSLAKKKK
jgi:hypothetical protein